MSKYIVYEIKVNDERIYIGRTKDLKRRLYEHRRGLLQVLNKKPLYIFLRDINFKPEDLELIPIESFKTMIESKRYEMLLILEDYFDERKLIQKVPSISDR